MNRLVGERLSIITSKAQTTRHRIHGMVNTDDYQIVYSDTPGIVDPAYKLHESMLEYVKVALDDADVLLVIVEVGEKEFKNEQLERIIKNLEIPVFVLLNKMDLTDDAGLETAVAQWKETFPAASIFPISALHGFGMDQIEKQILDALPEGPAYFSKDELTDRSERFFVSEIVREKVFLNYKKEIPYATEVVVSSFKEQEDIIRIRAEIMVERTSQKGILIGSEGKALKRVGIAARKDIEAFFEKQVYLDLHVKVDKDWRANEVKLRNYGYIRK